MRPQTPKAMPCRCTRNPLIASIGPLEHRDSRRRPGQPGCRRADQPQCTGCGWLVEPVTRLVPPARDRSLGATAALIELTESQGHDVEVVYDCPGLGDLLAGGALEPGETTHRHHLSKRSRRTPTKISTRIYAATLANFIK